MPVIAVEVTDQELHAIRTGFSVGITKDDIVSDMWAPLTSKPPVLTEDHPPQFARLADTENGMDVSARVLRDGIQLMIGDTATDSLAVVKLTRSYGKLFARVGLRGNWDVYKRPIHWMTTELYAPKIDETVLNSRKRRYAHLHPSPTR